MYLNTLYYDRSTQAVQSHVDGVNAPLRSPPCSFPRRKVQIVLHRLSFPASAHPFRSPFGTITQIYGRDNNNILSHREKQMNKSPCQDASAPAAPHSDRESACVFQSGVCTRSCTLHRRLCAFHLKCVITRRRLFKIHLVRFIHRLLLRFFVCCAPPRADQAAEMQSAVKLNRNNVNAIRPREIPSPLEFSYLFTGWVIFQRKGTAGVCHRLMSLKSSRSSEHTEGNNA